MTEANSQLVVLPCSDSDEMTETRKQELDLPRDIAAALGRSTIAAARKGYYLDSADDQVDWQSLVDFACFAKISIPPDDLLPKPEHARFDETRVQVTNETTLLASLRLVESGLNPLALNFANGVNPGGSFCPAPERRKRFFVDPAHYFRHWSTTRCMSTTANVKSQIQRIGRSTHPMYPFFALMWERSSINPGC